MPNLILSQHLRSDRSKRHEYSFEHVFGTLDQTDGTFSNIPNSQILKLRDDWILGYNNIWYRDEVYSRPSQLGSHGWQLETVNIDKKLDTQCLLSYIEINGESHNSNLTTLQLVADSGLLRNALSLLRSITGRSFIAFHHYIGTKISTTKAPNDAWHYDNHYDPCMVKLLIYINDQSQMNGGTDIYSIHDSSLCTELTGYIGSVEQRRFMYLVDDFASSNPANISNIGWQEIRSDKPFQALLFRPSVVLHRGIPPANGTRSIVSFSFMPLPENVDSNLAYEYSITALNVLAKKRMLSDFTPYFELP